MILVSIFNDVIDPVMRGPSSSHCAAALRIGRLARDLVGGMPEVGGCQAEGGSAAANALACANMALAGFDQVIPFDEVVATAKRVAEQMPRELRCTALGGLSITPTSFAIEQRLAARAAAGRAAAADLPALSPGRLLGVGLVGRFDVGLRGEGRRHQGPQR